MPSATQFSSTFVDEIASLEDGKDIRLCLQCGICSSGCPVREVVPSFNIRRLIAKMLLGLKEEVLGSDEIWLCARCNLCTATCRKNIRPGDIITAVRTLALRGGYRRTAGAKHTLAFLDDISSRGEINEATLPLKTLGAKSLALIPYGIRMFLKGRAPAPFIETIDSHDQVQALIDEFDD